MVEACTPAPYPRRTADKPATSALVRRHPPGDASHVPRRARTVVCPRSRAVGGGHGDTHEQVGSRRLDVVEDGERVLGAGVIEVDERARHEPLAGDERGDGPAVPGVVEEPGDV